MSVVGLILVGVNMEPVRKCNYNPVDDEKKLFSFKDWLREYRAMLDDFESDFTPPNEFFSKEHTFDEWSNSFGRWGSW